MPTIHDRIAELTDLAKTYAEDGAFHTAANRLRQLADEIDAHISAITTPGLRSHQRAAIEQMAQAGTNPDVIKPDRAALFDKEMRAGLDDDKTRMAEIDRLGRDGERKR